LALAFTLTSNSQAATVAVGDPVAGNSWSQGFITTWSGLDTLQYYTVYGLGFEPPGFSNFSDASWANLPGNNAGHIGASGNPLTPSIQYLVTFNGTSATPLAFDLLYYGGGNLLGGERAIWDGHAWEIGAIPVPEPSTVIAGALMLLPIGVSAIRRFRKS
jgi:hypothetical protein